MHLIGQTRHWPWEPADGLRLRRLPRSPFALFSVTDHPPPPDSSSREPSLGRVHARRLREMYRSAGWPYRDGIELELLAAGLLERVAGSTGAETLRLTPAGVEFVTRQMAVNRAALSAHEALVERVAHALRREGRIAWRGLSLRAQVQGEAGAAWCVARPDVFSIRNTSVAEYVEPVVHEVKVRRADLLGDLRSPAKRGAYLDLGECWYVLGQDARGRPIALPDEVPPECGVLLAHPDRLVIARPAPRRSRATLPFSVWMALAKASPVGAGEREDEAQGLLGEPQGEEPTQGS